VIATVTINPAFDKICLVDDFEANKVHRISEEARARTVIGGKGINISVMLKLLGIPSIAMGFSGGILGTKLELELRRLGVTTNFVRTEQETRTNLFVVDNKNDSLTVINVSGKPVSSEDIFLLMDRYRKILNQVDTVILAGSLLPEMDASLYGELIKIARNKNVRVFLNTYPKYLEGGIAENAYLVFPDMRSSTEFRGSTLGAAEDCINAGKTILDESAGTEIVIFSHLVESIVAIKRERAFVISQPKPHFANLLGFSDAIISGLVYGLEQNKPFKEAFSLGCAAGYTSLESQKKFCVNLENVMQRAGELRVEEIPL
jgi:1-phosphofructokinase